MFTISILAAAARHRLYFAYKGALARKSIRRLLSADERLLKDIGVTRADVIDSLSSRRGEDPSKLLIARRKDRDVERLTFIDHPARWREASSKARVSMRSDRAA
jgi:uncharacterized protein YjiS (DUF1127 family)